MNENYSSMMSNFLTENLAGTNPLDEEETFDRRPLLDLINELNRRHTLNQSATLLPLDDDDDDNDDNDNEDLSNERRISPSTPTLPPKSFSPFRPIILHKKYQVSRACSLSPFISLCAI